ncbi:MAG: hypothetical protein ACI83W_001002 [Marinoscillum sp.]|jgi:hypothetical protein
MVFTEIDRHTMSQLSTLVMLSAPFKNREEIIIHAGQYMGVPKVETMSVIQEWDELDTMPLNSEQEKQNFLEYCFAFMKGNRAPRKSEQELYSHVAKSLGLKARSNN